VATAVKKALEVVVMSNDPRATKMVAVLMAGISDITSLGQTQGPAVLFRLKI